MGLLLLGGFSAFLMHPETPFEEGDAIPMAVRPVAAGYTQPSPVRDPAGFGFARQSPVFLALRGKALLLMH